MCRACAPFIMIPYEARGGEGSMLIKYETNMWSVYGSLYRGRGAGELEEYSSLESRMVENGFGI